MSQEDVLSRRSGMRPRSSSHWKRYLHLLPRDQVRGGPWVTMALATGLILNHQAIHRLMIHRGVVPVTQATTRTNGTRGIAPQECSRCYARWLVPLAEKGALGSVYSPYCPQEGTLLGLISELHPESNVSRRTHLFG